MKKHLALLIVLCFVAAFTINAQTGIDSLMQSKALIPLIFKKNHFGFFIMAATVQKAKITGSSFVYNQSANNQLGLQAGFCYQINFSSKFAFNTGVGLALLGRNFSYAIAKESFSPPSDNGLVSKGINSIESPIAYLSLPITFERRWIKQKHFFTAFAGIELAQSIQSYAETSIALYKYNGNLIQIAKLDTDWDETSSLKIGSLLGAGYGFVTKHNNVKTLRLVAKISFSDLVKSTYSFTVPNQPAVNGSYAGRGSFFGLSFSYMFTNTNRRIRKLFS